MIIVSALTVAVVMLVIIPTIHDIKKISQAVYEERVDLERKYRRGQLLRETIKEFEKFQPQQGKLMDTFIVRGQELAFITTLEQIARQNNVTQDIQISFPEADNEKTFSEAPLTLSAQGSFSQIVEYMNNLERLNIYLIFSSLKMTAAGTQDRADLVTAIMSGKAYILNPDGE